MTETFKVHTYVGAESNFFVNSFWIETETGIIVIDTQFVISEAQKLKKEIEATNKPIKVIFVTHPHPDHFNGIGTLLDIATSQEVPTIPIYATQATLDVIKATEVSKRQEWTPTYGDDYPQFNVLPNAIVQSGTTVTVGDLNFKITDLGPGESANGTLIALVDQNVLFCADLVYNHVCPWLEEGRSSAWLEQLGFTLKTYPTVRTVYPGHGQPTTLLALNEQINYINTLQSLVRAKLGQGTTLSVGDTAAIKAEIETKFSKQPLAMLIDSSIDGIAAELSLQR